MIRWTLLPLSTAVVGWTVSTAFFPADGLVVIGLLNAMWIWQTAQEQVNLQPYSPEDTSLVIYRCHVPLIRVIAVSPNGRLIVTGSTDEIARILDARTGLIVATLKQHQSNVTAILFTPDGNRIVTASADSTAIIWDAQTYASLFTLRGFTLRGHIGPITAMCISPNGALLATGGLDGTVYLWSLQHGRRLGTLTKHNQRITCMGFSPDSNLLMSCDLLGHAVLWQVQRPELPELWGIYISEHEIGALHWQDNRHVTLADTGGIEKNPHFYRLALEGPW